MIKKSFLISLECVDSNIFCKLSIAAVRCFCGDLCNELSHLSKKDDVVPWWTCKSKNYLKFNGVLTNQIEMDHFDKLDISFNLQSDKETNETSFNYMETTTVTGDDFCNNDEIFMNYQCINLEMIIKYRILMINPFDCDVLIPTIRQKPLIKSHVNPILIGHRGLGKDIPVIKQENTINSFNKCAALGLEYCELDVHFTKDEALIIHHDFYLDPKDKKNKYNEFRHLTMDQIQLKLMKSPHKGLCPTLDEVLQNTVSDMGFLVEIKYPQVIELENESAIREDIMNKDGSVKGMRENHTTATDSRQYYFGKNYFVDKILKCIFHNVNKKPRNIVLLSFDPDLCLLLKQKQTTFPVMQLTRGQLYNDASVLNHLDDRMNTIDNAIDWAKFCGLDGIASRYLESVKKSIRSLKYSKFLVYCYGDIPPTSDVITESRYLGIDGLIIDNVEEFLTTVGNYYV